MTVTLHPSFPPDRYAGGRPAYVCLPAFPAAAKGDSLDWKDLSAAEITKRVTERVQPGSIVLFHNAAKHTPEALPGILETLISQGYTIVPISKLIHPGQCGTDYTIDHTGKQFLKQDG